MLQQAGLCSFEKKKEAASPRSGGQAGGDAGEKANQFPFPLVIPNRQDNVGSIKKKERIWITEGLLYKLFLSNTVSLIFKNNPMLSNLHSSPGCSELMAHRDKIPSPTNSRNVNCAWPCAEPRRCVENKTLPCVQRPAASGRTQARHRQAPRNRKTLI